MKKIINIIKANKRNIFFFLIILCFVKIAFWGVDVNIKTKRFDNRIPVAVSADNSITIDTLFPIEVNIKKE